VPRRRSVLFISTLVGALALQLVAIGPVQAAPALPGSMASTGDSITRAFATRTGFFWFTDNPAASWSTGTSSSVDSHYSRILAQTSAISGNNWNDAATGAVMADLAGQMQSVVSQHAEYVTVLMGANDVCADSVSQMTSVATFTSQLQSALAVLASGDPTAHVFIASIPDVYHLWDVLKDNSSARSAWSTYGICQAMLANPLSTAQADVDRRATVRQRNIDFNSALATACSDYGPNCRFDGNAVFGYPFVASQINTHDYFHPNVSGQAVLASVTWDASFWGSATPPPDNPPTAAFSTSCTELACTFTDQSADDGSIVGWSWSFGDGGTSTVASPGHTYATAGTYTVTLTVTDDGGLTDSATQPVTVSSGTVTIDLTASVGGVTKNREAIELTWLGTSQAAQMDVYRDGSLIATTANSGGYTDWVNARKSRTYTYQVCEAGTQTCSNEAQVTS
jgi:lysophospholipase L1-like esterase